jgi:tetratricopeptide (TPR) repeat protein
LTPEQLLAQGKAQYKAGKLAQALSKFEAALKLLPNHDEALGLAAETAFRLDDQVKARAWLLRRADAPGQKDSVKAFCFYRVGLSFWRDAHDETALYGVYREGKTVVKAPEKVMSLVNELIASGLQYADRAMALIGESAEAHNLKNLLHSEAAWLAADEKKATEERQKAERALRQALALAQPKEAVGAVADFGVPTVIVGEFPATKADESRGFAGVEGGQVLKRVGAVFPAVRARKDADPNDPATAGVTKEGGAYSLGSGRGALTAAYVPGKVKVEVLVSTAGNVVFAHTLQGRSDLSGSAVLAARKWKFAPAKFEGSPVQLSGVITFDMRPGSRQ